MRILLFIYSIAFLGALYTPVDAQAQNRIACPELEGRMEISLDFDPGRIVYDDNVSRRRLARLSKTKSTSNRQFRQYTMGLTQIEYGSEYRIETQGVALGRNRICARLKSVSMKVIIQTLKIYILRDFAPGSCEYDAILAHEHIHADNAQLTYQRNLPNIRRKLHREVERLGAVRDISHDRATKTLLRRLQLRMKPIMDRIEREMKRKNAAIDTPESYLRFNDRCPNFGK